MFPCCLRKKSPPRRREAFDRKVADKMPNQIVFQRSSMPLQRQKALTKQNAMSTSSTALVPSPPSRSARCAEVAGGTAAECAAVCCCCPCGVVSFIVLTVVRLPAGLCRKAIKRRRHKKTSSLQQPKHYEDAELHMDGLQLNEISPGVSPGRWPDKSPSAIVSQMEKEMWAKLYGTGFWRNPSEREH